MWKNYKNFFRAFSGICLSFYLGPGASARPSTNVIWPLQNPAALTTLSFPDIPPTVYRITQGILDARVKKSASFYIFPLERPSPVKEISFHWQASGQWNVKSAKAEESKEGDDARFRVALVLSGKSASLPWFAPDWLKSLTAKLLHPANGLFWMTAGSQHQPGETWISPWSDRITNMALSSRVVRGWHEVHHRFEKTKGPVSGIMFGADGDNSGSEFQVRVQEFKIILESAGI